jgi:hypothetical protein
VLGVWYNSSAAKWAIFHEDKTPVPVGATYLIYAEEDGSFIQTATTVNSGGDYTVINNPATNNQPAIRLIVTPNWSVGYVYDTHALGVWYSGGHWTIFHEDGTRIPTGASYNVLVAFDPNITFIQTATTSNSTGDWTEIDNPYYNNSPTHTPLITASFLGGVYDTHALGVWYVLWDGRWAIFHEDQTPIPLGATYNLF